MKNKIIEYDENIHYSQSDCTKLIEELTGKTISRQAIGNIRKNGTYNFFVDVGKNGKLKSNYVDISHPHWNAYLAERNNGTKRVEKKTSKKLVEKKPVKKNANKSEKKVSKKKVVKTKKGKPISDDELLENENRKQRFALTGGYDPDECNVFGTADIKRMTEIQEKQINMRVRLNELIEVEMLISVIETLGMNIDNFVNLSRMVSNKICQKLDRVGFEKEVEKIINPVTEKLIKITKKTMTDSIDIKSYND